MEFLSKELARISRLLSQDAAMREVDRDTFTRKRNILNRLVALFENPTEAKKNPEEL